ncbi:universal stress protein [Methylocystis parvus]|uniref:Universal stress protein n=1 Tax=Methylocystis parvus TaxID=134 RepID=A0A6B8M7Y4_9HYPH|nr:universal stress protein [Methylocystis parvus]QGM97443.1 universal stress protein [Methylocystis parvus]WBJ98639.1 universal stress protein [Methylocystis parvus OBBP]
MKQILLATDLSGRSDRAAARAALLARKHGARLTALHVVDDELPQPVAERQKTDAENALRQTFVNMPHASDLDLTIDVHCGQYHEAIIETAERLDADLIVIGKHREDVLLDLFRGSTGERVLRFGSRPVLVVKNPAGRDYLSALAAVDFSPTSRRALEFSWKLAPDAQAYLGHAFDVPFRSLTLGSTPIDQLAKKHQRQFHDLIEEQMTDFVHMLSRPLDRRFFIAREGSPESVVLALISELKAELLVLGTHGRSGLGRAILGSVAEALLASAPCDVLAVRGW